MNMKKQDNMEGVVGLSGVLCKPRSELWWSLSTGRIPWGLGCLKQHIWRTQVGLVILDLSKNGHIVYLIIE